MGDLLGSEDKAGADGSSGFRVRRSSGMRSLGWRRLPSIGSALHCGVRRAQGAISYCCRLELADDPLRSA